MKKNVQLSHLYASLFSNPTPPQIDEVDGSKKADAIDGTTIRPSHRVKQFYTYHANRLGISMQAIMAMTLEAVMTASTEPFKSDLNIVVERFKLLFESHHIAPIYINKILDGYTGRKFPMGAVTNEAMLLSTLDTAYFEALSNIFGVGIDWLDGRDMIPVKMTPILHRDWAYESARRLIHPLAPDHFTESHQLNIIVPEFGDPSLNDGFGKHAQMLLPITASTFGIGTAGKVFQFTTYHVEGAIPWYNDEARVGLKALIQCARDNDIAVQGMTHSHDTFVSLMYGNMPVESLEGEHPSFWNVRDYILEDERKGAEDSEAVAELYGRLKQI